MIKWLSIMILEIIFDAFVSFINETEWKKGYPKERRPFTSYINIILSEFK